MLTPNRSRTGVARVSVLPACGVLAALVVALSAVADMPEDRPRVEVPSVRALNLDDAIVETVLSGLDQPWAFEFIGVDEVLVTETRGRMLRVPLDGGPPVVLDGLPEIATERQQTGLLDIELHPEFHLNRRIYFSYVAPDETGQYYATALDTAILEAERLSARKTLLRVEPFAWSPSNFGGVLEFDPEGYLYVSVGDRSEPATAQMGDRLQGKILRLNDDGSVPDDNPFVDDPEIDDRIWALGVRNPQGLHYDGPSGFMYEAEHGPMGGDEINIIRRGANYGWPVISYGRNYTAEALGFEPGQQSPQLDFHLSTDPGFEIGAQTERKGMEQPLFYYLPSTAISPLTVVRGPMFPEWDGHILVGALKGRHVSKIDYDGRDVRSEVRILNEFRARIRDLNIADDGSIWILVQSGELYRLFRDPELLPAVRAASDPAGGVYTLVCSACHSAGVGEIPQIDRPGQWTDVLAKPREQVYRNVIDGLGAMPARGSCYRCGDEVLRMATDYLLDQVSEGGEDSDE